MKLDIVKSFLKKLRFVPLGKSQLLYRYSAKIILHHNSKNIARILVVIVNSEIQHE
ncbi:hypothetical protein BCM20_002404 [Clostridium beijerinckii]|uniref:hypothetical protein n=1 Tax=Clostridium beijerinckii TaxID=1520 RepID=UPI001494C064|nr:hypothetical protein [Clostridium beijerinckii]NOW04409.1 hypothetical protein [Clostridium beijerinckii]NRT35334.1 hypothetical protein [Clostridium beijerinckii]NRT45237.1 hypothetical protein [Clostridium beijerinckii]NRZ20766.1 hypothetical protein [Clostridium beijerinckii]NYC02449.1 hypothetical protein [Clostridium beijerinckii]